MLTRYRIYRPNTNGFDAREVELPPEPNLRDIEVIVNPILFPLGHDPGGFKDWSEHVRVFWPPADDTPAAYLDMFVDEHGALKSQPVNDQATAIYHNNMKVHRPAEFERGKPHPPIHGVAVLFLRQVWF